jgi:hypothetical protein
LEHPGPPAPPGRVQTRGGACALGQHRLPRAILGPTPGQA